MLSTSSVIYDGENDDEISRWRPKPNREQKVKVSDTTMMKKEQMLVSKKGTMI